MTSLAMLDVPFRPIKQPVTPKKNNMLALLVIAILVLARSYAQMHCIKPECHQLVDSQLYWMNGTTIRIILGSNQLTVYCYGNLVWYSNMLPQAVPAVSVQRISLFDCPLPLRGSFVNLFSSLGVTLAGHMQTLKLLQLPPTTQLTAKHFVGIENITALEISAKRDGIKPLRGFLNLLKNLRKLDLSHVNLSTEDMKKLPPSVVELILLHTRASFLERLPDAVWLLPALESVDMQTEYALDAGAVPTAPALRELHLDSPATDLQLQATSLLEILSVTKWTAFKPPVLTRCDQLRILELISPAMKELPFGWLASCSHLNKLMIENARDLINLPAKLFASLDLTEIILKDGALETLQVGLFDDAPNLRSLLLNGNRLQKLSSTLFLQLRVLEVLDLGSNELDSSSIGALAHIDSAELVILQLSKNVHLGDFCERSGYSQIRKLTSLRELDLSETNVTRICIDWQKDMTHLCELNLRSTKVSELSLEDLQYDRKERAGVFLDGAPITIIQATREAYNNPESLSKTVSIVSLDTPLQCDCRMYWTWLTLERLKAFDRFIELRCMDGRELRNLSPEELRCTAHDKCKALEVPMAACDVKFSRVPFTTKSHASIATSSVFPPAAGTKPAFSTGEKIQASLAVTSLTPGTASQMPPATHTPIDVSLLSRESVAVSSASLESVAAGSAERVSSVMCISPLFAMSYVAALALTV